MSINKRLSTIINNHEFNRLFIDKVELTFCKNKHKSFKILDNIYANTEKLGLKIERAKYSSGYDYMVRIPYEHIAPEAMYLGEKEKGIILLFKGADSIKRMKYKKRHFKISCNPYYWNYADLNKVRKIFKKLTGYSLSTVFSKSTITQLHLAYDMKGYNINTLLVRFKKATNYKCIFDTKNGLTYMSIGSPRGKFVCTAYNKLYEIINSLNEVEINLDPSLPEVYRCEIKAKLNIKIQDLVTIKNPFEKFTHYKASIYEDEQICSNMIDSMFLRGFTPILNRYTPYEQTKIIKRLEKHDIGINPEVLWEMYLDSLKVLNKVGNDFF